MFGDRSRGAPLLGGRGLDTRFNFGAEQLVVARIPCEDLVNASLDGTPGNQRIVDSAARYAVTGRLANAREIVLGRV
jgi:hypothetical protein